MSGLVRWLDEITPGVTALGCPRCKIDYVVNEHGCPEEDLGDPMRCLECDESGLIPRGGSSKSIGDRFPAGLAPPFVALPSALFDGSTLELLAVRYRPLTPTDKCLIAVLENCRYSPTRDWVWPGLKKIAYDAGCNEKTVRRRLDALVADGLLLRRRRRGYDGRFEHFEYSLRPLWEALLAAANLARQPSGHSVPHQRASRPGPVGEMSTEAEPLKKNNEEVPHGGALRRERPWEAA